MIDVGGGKLEAKHIPKNMLRKLTAKNKYMERFRQIMFIHHMKATGHKVIMDSMDKKLIENFDVMMESAG